MAFDGDNSLPAQRERNERNAYLQEQINDVRVEQARQDERLKQVERTHTEFAERVASGMKDIASTVSGMRDDFTRFKGAVGGVMLVLSLAGAFITIMRQQISSGIARIFK